eukprot:jgi/Bigna1/68805/fgenesh1_pg.7_\
MGGGGVLVSVRLFDEKRQMPVLPVNRSKTRGFYTMRHRQILVANTKARTEIRSSPGSSVGRDGGSMRVVHESLIMSHPHVSRRWRRSVSPRKKGPRPKNRYHPEKLQDVQRGDDLKSEKGNESRGLTKEEFRKATPPFSKWSSKALRHATKAIGLKSKGRKDALAERLADYMRAVDIGSVTSVPRRVRQVVLKSSKGKKGAQPLKPPSYSGSWSISLRGILAGIYNRIDVEEGGEGKVESAESTSKNRLLWEETDRKQESRAAASLQSLSSTLSSFPEDEQLEESKKRFHHQQLVPDAAPTPSLPTLSRGLSAHSVLSTQDDENREKDEEEKKEDAQSQRRTDGMGELLPADSPTAICCCYYNDANNVTNIFAKKEAGLDQTYDSAEVVIMDACGMLYPVCVRLILEYAREISPLSFQVRYGSSLLRYAAEGNINGIRRLQYGMIMSVNVRSEYNNFRAPLHAAAESGQVDVARFLIESLADVNIRDHLRASPLHLAAISNQLDVLQLLLKHGVIAFCQREAALSRDLYILIIVRGIKLDITYSNTLFSLGIYIMTSSIMIYADPNSVDKWGNPPVTGAAFFGNIEVVLPLIEEQCGFDEKKSSSSSTSPGMSSLQIVVQGVMAQRVIRFCGLHGHLTQIVCDYTFDSPTTGNIANALFPPSDPGASSYLVDRDILSRAITQIFDEDQRRGQQYGRR